MLDNLDEWHFTTCYYGCHTDVYYTDGDTLVDGKTYKILDGFHFISRTFLLREDIQDKKVFLNLVSPGNNQEYLLYDFSLKVGDSMHMLNPITPFPSDGGFFQLDSIVGKPLVNGNIYDFFYFSPTPSNSTSNWNAVWVEGIGSLSIITAPGGDPDFFGVGELSCFFKENELFYTNLEVVEECVSVLSVSNKSALEEVVLSKPANGTVCYLNNAEQVRYLEVFSVQGKRIMTFINDKNKVVSLELGNLKDGMYFILAKGNLGSKRVFKVVK
ncbi:MAG: T9SS type A sorting domain-containing protein [Aequorivita sp.]